MGEITDYLYLFDIWDGEEDFYLPGEWKILFKSPSPIPYIEGETAGELLSRLEKIDEDWVKKEHIFPTKCAFFSTPNAIACDNCGWWHCASRIKLDW